MSIADVTEESDEAKLLERLQKLGTRGANNFALMQELDWNPARYWSVRNRLIENSKVQKRRGGPGGTTILLDSVSTNDLVEVGSAAVEVSIGDGKSQNEPNLYKPMLKVIESDWMRDEGYDSNICRITAWPMGISTGGKWTRPDICVAAVQKFKFLRDSVFDVISFEIKPKNKITVEGIFEALAHRQSTTRAYIIYHISNEEFRVTPEADRIVELAEQHGVGVLLAEAPESYKTWTERVRARRWIPDPADLNEFLQRVFPVSDHDEIIKLGK